jgi:predicted DNA-binding transcriptional regulator YafY
MEKRRTIMGTSEYTILKQAMVCPDDYAVRLRYRSKSGELTERVVSPIKMTDSRSLLALCLCRENPRRFELDRCSHLELVPAHEVLMPMEMRILEAAPVKAPKGPQASAAKVPA